jgi:TIR domain/PBS lyase HEAT-like repeat
MAHIFISYARDDAAFAELLRDRLTAAGFEPWKDTESLRAGGVWAEEIDQAIVEAAALVVILTPESKQSEYVTYEFAFALGNGVPIIPLMLRPTRPHPRLEKFHYENFADGEPPPWDNLIKRLREESDPLHPTILRLSADLKNARTAEDGIDAARKLARTRHPAAHEALARAVRRPLPEVSFAAAVGLAEFGDERATPMLVDGLGGATQNLAFDSLMELGDKAIEGMIAALPSYPDKIESLLRLVSAQKATPLLVEALLCGGAERKKAAAKILGAMGIPAAADGLIQALGDEEEEVRLFATRALGATYSRCGFEAAEQVCAASRELVEGLPVLRRSAVRSVGPDRRFKRTRTWLLG